MDWTLEVVVVPVSDVDRAKAFYTDQVGFHLDHDSTPGPGMRLVQLTPPGSGCSIVLGKGMVPEMPPGSLRGLQLVVADLPRARETLVAGGVDVSEIQRYGPDPGTGRPEDLDDIGFVHFADPDGNTWSVQQISARG
ncbi:putative enzyme related to lactoylglutathione lyase [Amycolatopsis sulphurea]|uniref:Putative enzyme related to lactoylglutathione lyase n=1 Tax=Amycolatopsis sulphurea TaxID=76022 RepID=A0A2A9F8F9_9PSEU|nr:VOC family protein [Amycolatopsis sulphurea]PFG47096.1 putative enzyme related to lactoylglutathione lyase [Amycolatopsis sulphurea]